MKKKIVLTGLSALAVLTLASCNSGVKEEGRISYEGLDGSYTYEAVPGATTYADNGGKVDIYINYNGESGISFRGTSWNNSVDGLTYTQGSLLPTWTRIQELTNTGIRDASGYRASNLDTAYTSISTGGYKSETNSSQSIDLFYNSTSNLRTAGNAGQFVDLSKYLEEGKLPNLKAYLDANTSIKNAITTSGKIYYAPYLDGDNDVENTFIMDTAMVKKVLSEAANGDTTINGLQSSPKNVLQEAKYTAFIETDDTTVEIVENGVKTTKDIAAVENIITQQNKLLKDGCTGKQLAEQLVTYIKAKYAFYGDDVWELYVGEKAAYNTDELVALMRVIKANPGLLTGDANAEIEVFFPRGETSSSINSILELLQLWGVQGVDAENGNFYFSADGKLNALETTQAAYDALDYVSALYDEGLILENFYASSATSTANRYLDQYFKKTSTQDNSYGFMMYDDPTVVTVANDTYEGIGTSSRSSYAKDPVKGIYSVLPPRTYWTTTGNNSQKALSTTEGKTLARYYESNRSLQTTSWAIPANSDNIDGALRIIDFMYSELGQLIQNYGPEAYWEKTNEVVTNMTSNGEKNAIISYKTKLELVSSQRDFWSFMRGYIGATHGIGYVRLSGLNLQATNHYGQIGLKNVQNAIQLGVVGHATNKDSYTWDASVPTQFSTTVSDDKNNWDGISGFWAVNKLNKNEGWVNVVTSAYGTPKTEIVIRTLKNVNLIKYEDMLKQQEKYNTICLREYANSLGAECIPDYAKK